jgi:hypothetical protein
MTSQAHAAFFNFLLWVDMSTPIALHSMLKFTHTLPSFWQASSVSP